MARQPVSTNAPRQAGGGGGVSANARPLAQRADRANALAQTATAEDEKASSSHAPLEHKQQVAGEGKEGQLAPCSPLASKKAEKAMIVRVVGETSTSSGGYLHRSKAIMAFEEEERGKDLVILALYVNEFGADAPPPNVCPPPIHTHTDTHTDTHTHTHTHTYTRIHAHTHSLCIYSFFPYITYIYPIKET